MSDGSNPTKHEETQSETSVGCADIYSDCSLDTMQ